MKRLLIIAAGLALCGCAQTKGSMTLPNGAKAEAAFTRMFWQTGDGELEFDPVTGKVKVGIKQSQPNAESLKVALDGAANIAKLLVLAQQPTNAPPISTNKTMLIEFAK